MLRSKKVSFFKNTDLIGNWKPNQKLDRLHV
jgi:hypothetical protein